MVKKWFETKKKRVMVAITVGVLGVTVLSGTVMAAEEFQPVSLNSHGVWIFDDGNAENNNGKKYDIVIDASDMEKINRNVNVLDKQVTAVQNGVETNAGEIGTLKNEVAACFQSVSDGKALLASTLTDLGVSTAADATFATINDNIKALATMQYNAGLEEASKNGYRYGGIVDITSTGSNEVGAGCVGSVKVSKTVKALGVIDGGFKFTEELGNGWAGTSFNVSSTGDIITLGSRGEMSVKVIWFY